MRSKPAIFMALATALALVASAGPTGPISTPSARSFELTASHLDTRNVIFADPAAVDKRSIVAKPVADGLMDSQPPTSHLDTRNIIFAEPADVDKRSIVANPVADRLTARAAIDSSTKNSRLTTRSLKSPLVRRLINKPTTDIGFGYYGKGQRPREFPEDYDFGGYQGGFGWENIPGGGNPSEVYHQPDGPKKDYPDYYPPGRQGKMKWGDIREGRREAGLSLDFRVPRSSSTSATRKKPAPAPHRRQKNSGSRPPHHSSRHAPHPHMSGSTSAQPYPKRHGKGIWFAP